MRYTGASLRAVGMMDDEIAARAGSVWLSAGLCGTPVCSASAEQRTAQSAQWCEERDSPHSRAPAAAVVRGVTRGELTHQRRSLGRLALRDGGAAQHCEMAVEARAGRAAPASDRRDSCPAAHCYLFHVTPHPYESTRPGQANPIAPSRHSGIAGAGFTLPVRGLTVTLRIRPIPGRVGQLAGWWVALTLRRARRSQQVTSPWCSARSRPRARRRRRARGSAVGRWGA